MKKQFKFAAIAAMMAAAVVSCSKDDENNNNNNGQDTTTVTPGDTTSNELEFPANSYGKSNLEYVTMSSADVNAKEEIYSVDYFNVEGLNNEAGATIALTNNYVGTVAGGKDLSADSFFTQTAFRGAVEASNDWTAGWTFTADTDVDALTYGEDLGGEITANTTIAKGNYKLTSVLTVKAPAVLTIEPGVVLVAQEPLTATDPIYILVEKGAKIMAEGTASEPIVMTSVVKNASAWGGLHICGDAKTNAGAGSSEIGNSPFGGNNDADNSGKLKYIRLEYTGFALDSEHEANGISFYGVGNGTEVSFIQAYRGSDDGFEFFGGSVNIKNMVATSCSDDSYDWTDGWRGKAQFLVAYHEAADVTGYECDCLMECDNSGDNNVATPMSHPTIANVTLVGNNSDVKLDGVMLKAGTEVSLYNALITGKQHTLSTKTEGAEYALVNGANI